MTPFRFLALVTVCVGWGLHFSVIKATVDDVPIFFYVCLRMASVALILSPFLRWHRGKMVRILAGGACFGAFNYIFLFSGLKYTTVSLGAVLIETYMPIATILSVIFLRERIGWRRILGLVLAFGGVVIILAGGNDDLGARNLPLGALLILCGASCEAMGAILVKKIEDVSSMQLLVWFGVVGAVVTGALTLTFETGQIAALTGEGRWRILSALVYSVLVASVFGHGVYYWLLQRVDVSQVAGPTMMTTVFAVAFGVFLMNDPLTWRFLLGSLITMVGVAIIVLRTGEKSPEMAATLAEEESHGA